MFGENRVPLRRYVVLGYHWPFADPDESESIESAVERLDEILFRVSYEERASIDRANFFTSNAEFAIEGSDLASNIPEHGIEVGLANYRYIKDNLIYLFEKNCWNGVVLYPPAAVLAVLVREQLTADWEYNFSYVNGIEPDDVGAFLDANLKSRAQLFAPTIALFVASLTVANLRSPRKERDDNPTPADIDIGRTVLENMRKAGIVNPKVEAFKVAVRAYGHKASSKKMGVVFKSLTRKMR